jgi:E3 ubiquitin-protein ligase HUWE1
MVQKSLVDTKDFWSTCGGTSKLSSLLEFSGTRQASGNAYYLTDHPAGADDEAANHRFRLLVTLETRVTLLSEVYATGGHTTGRTAFTVLQSLLGQQSPKIVPDLGALHRACTWEHIAFKKLLTESGIEPLPNPVQAGPSANAAAASSDVTPTVVAENILATGSLPVIRPPVPSASEQSSARKKNAQALRHVVTQMPAALAPLFQGRPTSIVAPYPAQLFILCSGGQALHRQSSKKRGPCAPETHQRLGSSGRGRYDRTYLEDARWCAPLSRFDVKLRHSSCPRG